MRDNRNLHNRLPHIDALRGVAVVLVVWHHYLQFSNFHTSIHFLNTLTQFFLTYGSYGVQVFFCLSGFIILTRQINKTESESLIRFMMLRYLRLWPGIFILSLISLPLLGTRLWWHTLFPSFSLIDPIILNKIFGGSSFNWLSDVMWSLFSEIRFYFFFSLIFYFNRRQSNTINTLLLASVFGLGKVLTIIGANSDAFRFLEFLTLSRDSTYFVVGALVALVNSKKISSVKGEFFARLLPAIVGIVFEFVTKTPAAHDYLILIPMLSLSLNLYSSGPITRFLGTYIGKASYLTYLLHSNLFLLINKFLGPQSDWLVLTIIPFAVISISFVIEKFIESKLIIKLRSLI